MRWNTTHEGCFFRIAPTSILALITGCVGLNQAADGTAALTPSSAHVSESASSACTVAPVPGGVTIRCGSTQAFLANGSNGANGFNGANGSNGENGSAGAGGVSGSTGPMGPSGPAGATGPQGPMGPQGPAGGPTGPQGPAGPSSSGLVLKQADGSLVGTFLAAFHEPYYDIWDDTAGGNLTYNSYTGKTVGLGVYGNQLLYYLDSSCSGPAYAPTNTESGSVAENRIFKLGNSFYKVSTHEVALALGTPLYVQQASDDGSILSCGPFGHTADAGFYGTYSEAVLVTSPHLPSHLALPVRIERQ